MITNFENQTQELNEYELSTLLPIVVRGLMTKKGKENAITNKSICKALKEQGLKITDTRLRKIVHHIRANDIIPLLLATSKGYYISTDNQEIENYIQSLKERANSINFIKTCLQKQLSEKVIREPNLFNQGGEQLKIV
jgi:hypothetical protein